MNAKNRAQQETALPARKQTGESNPGTQHRVREKFSEPQGWALKWDGFGLHGFSSTPEAGARQNAPESPTTSR